jgi:hypothetical protein
MFSVSATATLLPSFPLFVGPCSTPTTQSNFLAIWNGNGCGTRVERRPALSVSEPYRLRLHNILSPNIDGICFQVAPANVWPKREESTLQ